MNDDKLIMVDEVSQFLRKTCLPRDVQPWQINVNDIYRGFSASVCHPATGMNCRRVPTNTGSIAELYMEPMITCIGDVDIMYYYDNELAVPKGRPLPTLLPDEFNDSVRVLEIVDSDLPGYVHLVFRCMLSKNCSDGTRFANDFRPANVFLGHASYTITRKHPISAGPTIHGPALRCNTAVRHIGGTFSVMDSVPYVRCLEWPPQAAYWPRRQRNYEWPNPETVDAIVQSGCDLVGVAHTICKEDDWMRNHQWRLSFSRAEVVLLNSWLPEQQIVYHMLRVFMKTERLTEMSKNGVADTFSNYHIKTLMLWACERYPQKWWTDGSNLVSVCVKIIQFLKDWLTKLHGQHYFLDTLHFSDYFDDLDVDTISAVAESTTEDSLATWFFQYYIRRCAKICPDTISVACCDQSNKEHFRETLAAIISWRNYIVDESIVKRRISQIINVRPVIPGPAFWMQLFTVLRRYLCSGVRTSRWYLMHSLVTFLEEKYITGVAGDIPTDIAIDVIAACSKISDVRQQMLKNLRAVITSKHRNCSSPLMVANSILKRTASHHSKGDVYRALLVQLAKVYLMKALSLQDSTYFLINVYLAVVNYTTGRFQSAIDHCILVTKSQDHTGCKSFRVQGDLLPKIGDNIDDVLGLAVLYQYVRALSTKQQSQAGVGVFTTEVFAHYLLVKHLSVAKTRLVRILMAKRTVQDIRSRMYDHLRGLGDLLYNSETLFISDLLLCKSPSKFLQAECKCVMHATSVCKEIDIFSQLSVEKLINFCRLRIPRNVSVNGISDSLALMLYRCKLYEQCVEQCRRHIHDIDATALRLSATYNKFIQLMDSEIVSLIGVSMLMFVARGHSQLPFPDIIAVSQPILSLYLLMQCQPKLRHPSEDRDTLLTLLDRLRDWIAIRKRIVTSSTDRLMLLLIERKLSLPAVVFFGKTRLIHVCRDQALQLLSCIVSELNIGHVLSLCHVDNGSSRVRFRMAPRF